LNDTTVTKEHPLISGFICLKNEKEKEKEKEHPTPIISSGLAET